MLPTKSVRVGRPEPRERPPPPPPRGGERERERPLEGDDITQEASAERGFFFDSFYIALFALCFSGLLSARFPRTKVAWMRDELNGICPHLANASGENLLPERLPCLRHAVPLFPVMTSTTQATATVATTVLQEPAPVIVQITGPEPERPRVRWDEKNAIDNEGLGKKSSKSAW